MTLGTDLARIERNAVTHLRLSQLGVILRSVELAEDADALVKAHPFVGDYLDDLARLTSERVPSEAAWRKALDAWSSEFEHLPLQRLKAAGLSDLAIDILLTLGLAEEDARFVGLFGETDRLTLGMLVALCRNRDDELYVGTVASEIAYLCDLGLVTLHNSAGVRHSWQYGVAAAVWDALAGLPRFPAGLELTPVGALPDTCSFIPPIQPFTDPEAIADLVRERRPILCLRGPSRNGRHLLAGAVMRALGKPLLSVGTTIPEDPSKWALIGVLACLNDAGLAIELAPGPGEDQVIPAFPLGNPFLVVIAGNYGGIRSAGRSPLVTISVPAPDSRARAALWRRVADVDEPLAGQLANSFRLTSGNLVRAAEAAMFRNEAINPALVQEAVCGLRDARLETVARRVEPGSECDLLALDQNTFDELHALFSRCRHREELGRDDMTGMTGQAGVRALLSGPSGTGKTLASRWLARRLGKDLYRLDLAAVVSKYIGETEKLLDRAFAAAEDLDCILLIDEGDALMAGRTAVGSSNDRYANLETNFLLQRIETFEGILVVTTNAVERIDTAFARRMDAVVDFRAPDEVLRFAILDRHLGHHEASRSLLEEIACRCGLTGGQLRNIAQHARLLAVDDNRSVADPDLRSALVREYRKMDAHCPLKPQLAAVV